MQTSAHYNFRSIFFFKDKKRAKKRAENLKIPRDKGKNKIVKPEERKEKRFKSTVSEIVRRKGKMKTKMMKKTMRRKKRKR